MHPDRKAAHNTLHRIDKVSEGVALSDVASSVVESEDDSFVFGNKCI